MQMVLDYCHLHRMQMVLGCYHLHHMLKRSLGVKGAALTLYAIGTGFATLGVALSLGRARVVLRHGYIGVSTSAGEHLFLAKLRENNLFEVLQRSRLFVTCRTEWERPRYNLEMSLLLRLPLFLHLLRQSGVVVLSLPD